MKIRRKTKDETMSVARVAAEKKEKKKERVCSPPQNCFSFPFPFSFLFLDFFLDFFPT